MGLKVNYKTPTKVKSLLLQNFSQYREEIESLKGKDVLRALETIIEYTSLKLKMKANESLSVSDFFDNPKKVKHVLEEYVTYPYDGYYDTRYHNESIRRFNDDLFNGFAEINSSFLRAEQDTIILILREKEIL